MQSNQARLSVIPNPDEVISNGQLPAIRVLIIDDQNLFREGLARLLSGQPGMEVAGTADTVAVAIAQLRQIRPDVALVGWPASSTNGQKIFAAVQEAKLPTRIIMLIDHDTKEDFVEAVKQGCCGIVRKQTSSELLIKSIRKVQAGEFWLDRMTTAEVIRRLTRKSAASANLSVRFGPREYAAALSARERAIVKLVAQGFKNKEMAERMFISEQTVKNHLHNIFDKLGVSDRLELALYAIHHNLHED